METMQSELKLAHDQMGSMWEELGRQQVTNPLVSTYVMKMPLLLVILLCTRSGSVSECTTIVTCLDSFLLYLEQADIN